MKNAVLFLILSFIFKVGAFAETITQVALVKVYAQEQVTSNTIGVSQTAANSITLPTSDIYIPPYDDPYSINLTFAEKILDDHNSKRVLHGASLLHWNNTIFNYAAAYAAKYDCSGILTHSGGPYGENLAIGYSTDGATEAWYDEGNNFPYGTETEYNHFTQMIWNSSTSLGCAYKYCNPTWGTYIICSYYPAGNIIGYESNNVFPLV